MISATLQRIISTGTVLTGRLVVTYENNNFYFAFKVKFAEILRNLHLYKIDDAINKRSCRYRVAQGERFSRRLLQTARSQWHAFALAIEAYGRVRFHWQCWYRWICHVLFMICVSRKCRIAHCCGQWRTPGEGGV